LTIEQIGVGKILQQILNRPHRIGEISRGKRNPFSGVVSKASSCRTDNPNDRLKQPGNAPAIAIHHYRAVVQSRSQSGEGIFFSDFTAPKILQQSRVRQKLTFSRWLFNCILAARTAVRGRYLTRTRRYGSLHQ